MKTKIYLITLLSLTVSLTACAGHHGEVHSIPALNNAQWPTPVAAAPAATTTPFPKITLADVTTAADTSAATGNETAGVIEAAFAPVVRGQESVAAD